LDIGIRVLGFSQSPHFPGEFKVNEAIRLTLSFVPIPKEVVKVSNVVANNAVVGHCPPAWDIAQVPSFSK
jgi:hypothetical protein